jgi:hypothetical protein
MVTAPLENVQEARDIRRHVHVRVCDAVSHASLCSEVDDTPRPEFPEDMLNGNSIG